MLQLTDPGPVEVDRDEGRWDGEVVNKGVQLQHEPELVWRSNEADDEVNHEEDVEGQINLLGGVLDPGNASFNIVTKSNIIKYIPKLILETIFYWHMWM